jgi:hypothetical protein
MPMHRASDYIHPTLAEGNARVRVYLPQDKGDAPVVICSAHQIAAEVISYNEFALPPIWIEHYPTETTDGASEAFEMVVFSSYEMTERAPYLGETRLTIGEPTWRMLDRETVEMLVGQEV